jgi:uncharacterized membrane protein YgcG
VNVSDAREQALAQRLFHRFRSTAYALEAAESLVDLPASDFAGTVALLPSRLAAGARGGQAAMLALTDLHERRERQELARPLKWRDWDAGSARDGGGSGGGGGGSSSNGGGKGGGKGGGRAKKK